jgi:predicted nucleic acid-binding protein
MPIPLLLDSNILTCVLRPEVAENHEVAQTMIAVLGNPQFELFVPEVIDYEVRRKLLHLGQHQHHARKWAREALVLLDELVGVGYIPLTTFAMRLAAELWAKTRAEGRLRGTEVSLDVDVILAAQAKQVGGQIVTMNEKHFRGMVEVFDWRCSPGIG